MPRCSKALLGVIVSTWAVTMYSNYLLGTALPKLGLFTGSLDTAEHWKAKAADHDVFIRLADDTVDQNYQYFLQRNDLIGKYGSMLNSSQKAALTRMFGKVLLGSSYLTSQGNQTFWKTQFPLKRILVVSSNGRSGSSFIGELISSFPGSFYTFEPLVALEILPDEKVLKLEEAPVDVVREWLSCSFKNRRSNHLKRYLKRIPHMRKSYPITEVCPRARKLCTNPLFMGDICSVHPINVVKVIRLWLKDVQTYLEDDTLDDMKAVLLIRDPRAILLASMKTVGWCSSENYVEIMNTTCKKIDDDLTSFGRLARKYPGRLYLLRYEDLISHVTKEAQSLFQFLELPVRQETLNFIATHTGETVKDNYGTKRNSSSVLYQWLSAINDTEVRRVEELCSGLMKTAGYPLLLNQSKDTFRY